METINPLVFISYARDDGRIYADQLYEQFKAANISAWRDERSLNPHHDYSVEIEAAIDKASHVVVCLTPSILTRHDSFVRREIIYAQNLAKPITPLVMPMFDRRRIPILITHLTHLEIQDIQRDFPRVLERINEEVYQPPTVSDPFHSYLKRLYEGIVDFLNDAVMTYIELSADETREAVSKPKRKRDMLLAFLNAQGYHQPGQTTVIKFDNIHAAFDHYDKRMLLLGDPGAGKTITLITYARDAITERLLNPDAPLPLLGSIPSWDSQLQPSLAEWLADGYPELILKDVQEILEQHKGLLLLDGLDELGNEKIIEQDDFETGEKTIIDRYDPRQRFIAQIPHGNQVLLTCRSEDYLAIGAKINLHGAVTLNPLTDDQIFEYLGDQPELQAIIEADTNLLELVRTPLLLNLFAFAFQDNEETRALRKKHHSESELRDDIISTYIHRSYDWEKHKRSLSEREMSFTLDEVYEVLGRIALWDTEASRTGNLFTEDDFGVVVGKGKAKLFVALASQLNLLRRSEQGKYRFSHILIRNHFAFRPALKGLEQPTMHVRYNAVEALGRIGDPRAIEALVELALIDQRLRKSIIQAIGQMGDAAVKPLMKIFTSNDWRKQKLAAHTLSEIGTAAVVPLIQAMNHKNPDIRGAGADALGRIGDPFAVSVLAKLLNDDSETSFPVERIYNIAARALEQIGTPEAHEALKQWADRNYVL